MRFLKDVNFLVAVDVDVFLLLLVSVVVVGLIVDTGHIILSCGQ